MTGYIIAFGILTFCVFFLIRVELVYHEVMTMIKWHYDYNNKYSPYHRKWLFGDCCPSFGHMAIRFWVCPISKFYPEYHAWKIKNKN